MKNKCLLAIALLVIKCPYAFATDLDLAPPPFELEGRVVTPVDFEQVTIDFLFNYTKQVTTGTAVVRFRAGRSGYPMLDLVADDILSITLNGSDVPISDFPEIRTPGGETVVRVLKRIVKKDRDHTLRIKYHLDSGWVTYDYVVKVGFFMTDLDPGGQGYFERFGPASFEYDHVKYTFNIQVDGATSSQVIFTNGAVQKLSKNRWSVVFPDYFTSSSIYFHLTGRDGFYSRKFVYEGQSVFPVTVYSYDESVLARAISEIKTTLAELEGDYGVFPHEHLLVYITPEGGGMEYGGAAMTGFKLLGHELLHSWFGRGVVPANGNAAWIDEAIASWRDEGYQRKPLTNGDPVNLGGFTPYRRDTAREAYYHGRRLIEHIDYLVADRGGLKPGLNAFVAGKKRKSISVFNFQTFLEGYFDLNLDKLFARYVFGKTDYRSGIRSQIYDSSPHRRYTKEELRRYR